MDFNSWIKMNEGTENSKVKAMHSLVDSIRSWGDKYSISTRNFVWEHLNSPKGKELIKKILRNPKTYFSDSEFVKLVENFKDD